MKSQVSFLLERLKQEGKQLDEQVIADIAYAFQEATVETLGKRLIKIAKEQGARTVAVAGGVSANTRLIEYIKNSLQFSENNSPKFSPPKFLYPAKKVYSTHNGAMIGVAGILSRMT